MMAASTGQSRVSPVRESARLRARRRRRLIRVLVAVVVLLLVVSAAWLVWFSPVFAARSVEVEGAVQIDAAQVVDAAQVRLGTPLARLDTSAVHDRVAALPAVAEVQVSRRLPSTVEITVTERQGVYAIAEAGQFLLVDKTGTGFLSVPSLASPLPQVALTDDGSPQAQRLMADAAVVVSALPASVSSQMTGLSATTPDTFLIDLTGGAQIFWGSADRSDDKAAVIDALLHTPASYYDISAPDHPATR